MSPYERVQILGRGSYGTAVLVRAPAGALRVAKEVDLDSVDEKRRAEALREAEVLKSLVHPNIIRYDEAFLDGQTLCIVMEYAQGGDLAGAIARRRADGGRRYHEREAMSLFAQLSMALEHVHSRRILHRDLKAANVFLHGGAVKLGDFGIARVLEAYEHCADTRIGTPFHLPPEIVENKSYDFKADIWSLGVLLYEMLALEVPFKAPSVAGLAVRICTAEPRPIPAVYSGKVRELLGRMLAKCPEDRPTSAEVAALPHVRRGILAAGLLPSTPVAPDSLAPSACLAGAVAAAGQRPQVADVPTPMSAARHIGRPAQPRLPPACTSPQPALLEEPATESPKRARLMPSSGASRWLPTVAEAGTSTPPPPPPLPLPPRGLFGFSPEAPPSPCLTLFGGQDPVTRAELAEACAILGASPTWGLGADFAPTPPPAGAAAAAVRCRRSSSRRTTGPLPAWQEVTAERPAPNSAGRGLDMSSTCRMLLQELENELNLA